MKSHRGSKTVSSAKKDHFRYLISGDIRIWLELEGKTRDLALFNMAFDSKLRGCDLVKLKISDVAYGRILPTYLNPTIQPYFSWMDSEAWPQRFAVQHTFHEKNKTLPYLQENQEYPGDPTSVGL
jgi:hypothetical protein